jgi:SAM-dependent methyltransferase
MPMAERHVEWDRIWEEEPFVLDAPASQARTVRWRAQERLVRRRLGGFAGLRAIEVGAGRALNGFLFAERGAEVAALDSSPVALEQAAALFRAHGLALDTVAGDVFHPPAELLGRHDVCMSYGLCEHFLGERRGEIVRAHLALLRPGGLALLGVPNRLSPVYRLWMSVLKRRGTWPLETEEPYSAGELAALAREGGGEPLAPIFGAFVATVVDHGVNQILYKLGRKGLPVPQRRLPFVDHLAYELVVPVVRR